MALNRTRLLEGAAGAGGAQAEEEDDAAADGHDPHLAADDRQRHLLLGLGGEGLDVEVAELALGGAGAGALGEEGDEQRQQPVEVVEVVVRFVAGEDEQAAEQRLQEDREPGRRAAGTRSGIEGRSRIQAMPPTAKAIRLQRISAQPTTRCTSAIAYFLLEGSGFRLLMRKITM